MTEKIYNLINNKYVKFFILAVVLSVTLRKTIENILNKTIVEFWLSNITTEMWYYDAMFILFGFVIYIIARHKHNLRYYSSHYISIIMVILSVYYFYYRNINTVWILHRSYLINELYYTDIIFVIVFLYLCLYCKNEKKQRSDNNLLFSDNSLGDRYKDELGYQAYTEELAHKVLNSNFDKSFAIGINGKWGVGKTSFIDLLKREIKGDDIISIDFKPWNNDTPKAVIIDFFETVQKHISPYHYPLSRTIMKYSNKLVKLKEDSLTKSVHSAISFLYDNEPLSELYTQIDNALRSIDKKLIIYIDDLDRLDKEEIVEVMRLIRNTANFYNTFFIVAYDRNYVTSALEQLNSFSPNTYLEKIFQLEINMPYFRKHVLLNNLAGKIKKQLQAEDHYIIDSAILNTSVHDEKIVFGWIQTMRDTTRLANSILLNYPKLTKEVVFSDFLKVEILRMKYPLVYELLKNNTDSFLNIYNGNYSLKDEKGDVEHGSMQQMIDRNNDEKSGKPAPKLMIENYLSEHKDKLKLSGYEIKQVVAFSRNIFKSSTHQNTNLSIVNPGRFHLYFSYSLINGFLSENEFVESRPQSQEYFNYKIAEWVGKGLESEVADRFYAIDRYDSRIDFERIISGIFHLANQKSHKSENTVYYNRKDLIYRLNTRYNRELKKFYGKNTEDLNSFVKSLLYSAIYPYNSESNLIIDIIEDNDEEFVLSKDELLDIAYSYMKKYFDEVEKFNDHFFTIFYATRDKQTSGGFDSYNVSEKVNKLLKEFAINKDFEGFLLNLIKLEDAKQEVYRIDRKEIVDIFGSCDEFHKILSKRNTSKYIAEFEKFYTKYLKESKDEFPFIEFDFSIIPINNKKRSSNRK